ncbi:MAG: short-chain dehydrogenase/reductase [Pseudomonadota bacterium]
MNLKLDGKHALITGASKGIGFACAMRLAQEGCNVRLVARTEVDLEAAKQRIAQHSRVEVKIFPCDLSQGEAARALMAANRDIDILINNAGAIPNGDIASIDEAAWREAWDLKVFGYINTCREAFTAMKERGTGVIINIIGVGGERPTPGYIVGGAGNSALMALSRALGSDSLKYGVRVIGVNPGLIRTERLRTQMQRLAKLKFGDESRWQELVNPELPPGEPENIADTVALLASDLSGYTTGTIVTIDGGASARFA